MQVTLDVMAWDGKSDLEVLALTAALAALRNANLPIGTCPGVARVSRIQGSLVTNPTAQQQAGADLSLLYAGAGSTANLVHMQVGYAFAGALELEDCVLGVCNSSGHGQEARLHALRPFATPLFFWPHQDWLVLLSPTWLECAVMQPASPKSCQSAPGTSKHIRAMQGCNLLPMPARHLICSLVQGNNLGLDEVMAAISKAQAAAAPLAATLAAIPSSAPEPADTDVQSVDPAALASLSRLLQVWCCS